MPDASLLERLLEAPGLVLVILVVWGAVKVSQALRARDVDYSQAMRKDMAERERRASEQQPPARAMRRRA